MKKLKPLLDGVKSWAELCKWYILAVAAATPLVVKFWRTIPKFWQSAAIQVSLDARLLSGIAILISFGVAALVWRLRHPGLAVSSADVLGTANMGPQKRPEIEDRLLSILWNHKGIQIPFFARFMPETAPTLEYHLERLAHDRLIFRTGAAWTINPNGKDYVVARGLENLVETGRGRIGGKAVINGHGNAADEIKSAQASTVATVRRKIRVLVDRMEAEKKRCSDGSATRTTMDHSQADLEAIDADLLQMQESNTTFSRFGLSWNTRNEPICAVCGKALSFHDDRSLRCFPCNRDFAPNDGGRAISVADALKLQNGAIGN